MPRGLFVFLLLATVGSAEASGSLLGVPVSRIWDAGVTVSCQADSGSAP